MENQSKSTRNILLGLSAFLGLGALGGGAVVLIFVALLPKARMLFKK